MADLERRLHSVLEHETQNVFPTRTAEYLWRERYAIGHMIHDRLNDVVGEFHVFITLVALENLTFGDDFLDMIERVEIARREIIYAEQRRDRDLIYADALLRAADYEARTLERFAQADANVIRIHAQADAQALLIMINAWSGVWDDWDFLAEYFDYIVLTNEDGEIVTGENGEPILVRVPIPREPWEPQLPGDDVDVLAIREVMLRQQAIANWDGVLPNVVGSGDFGLILNEIAPAVPATPTLPAAPTAP